MRFIDEATITVQSGDGGSGCVSFRRERFVPRGGPDGGDGGDGGDVIFRADPAKRTLYHLNFKKHFKAENGAAGQGSQKTGKSGRQLVIEVPPGTIIMDAGSGDVLYDLNAADQQVVVAQGGRGGQGNRRFKSSTNRAPRFCQPGEPGVTFDLKLELKLIADIGIIGLPNAGKSTLISVISSAQPKIGHYPFTTLTPNLGVVKPDYAEPFVVADIPGLIEGAHQGAGLGIRFLRHVERTRILVHLVDAGTIDANDPLSGYRTICDELARYSAALAEKKQLVVLNKMDMPESAPLADLFCDALKMPVMRISAAARQQIQPLVAAIVRELASG